MHLTTDEAFKILESESIIQNRQTLLRFIREGKIKAYKRSNKFGYRIDKESLRIFVEENRERDVETLFEKLERVMEENERLAERVDELTSQLKTPESHITAENLKLAEKVKDLEEEIERLHKKLEGEACEEDRQ